MKTLQFLSLSGGYFEQWTRKAYSVFQSLRKVVHIGRVGFTYSMVICPLFLMAQADVDSTVHKIIDLEQVVVSAQRAPVVYEQASRMLQTYNAVEIDAQSAIDIQELLEHTPGLDMKQRGVNGVQGDLSIRGGSFDQNLILLDGINISDPQTGHHSLNLPIPFSAISQIEVLKGPGSRIFGPNAFSGAVNILPKQPDSTGISLTLMGGSHELNQQLFEFSFRPAKSAHYLAIDRLASEGYTDNTDMESRSVFYAGRWLMPHWETRLNAGFTDKAFGAQSFYTPAYPNQFEQIRTHFVTLSAENTRGALTVKPAVYWRRHADRFELFRNEAPSWYTHHNYHLTDIIGAKADATLSWRAGKTSVGVELRSENIWSNVLGETMNDTLQALYDEEGYYTKSYSRVQTNAYLEHAVIYNKWAITGGVLLGWSNEQAFDWHIYPGIDVSYRLFPEVKLYGSVNTALRYPTFTDLFYTGPSNQGNPDLLPEEAMTYEGGARWTSAFFTLKGSYFYREGENIIAWTRDMSVPDSKWMTQNFTKVKTQGLELVARLGLADLISCTVKPTSLELSYTYLDQSKSAGLYESKYSLSYLRHKAVASINWACGKHISLFYQLHMQERAGSYQKYDFTINAWSEDVDYEPYALHNAKLQYQNGVWKVYASVNNLFNSDYIDFGNIEMPGRWLKLGVNYSLGL